MATSRPRDDDPQTGVENSKTKQCYRQSALVHAYCTHASEGLRKILGDTALYCMPIGVMPVGNSQNPEQVWVIAARNSADSPLKLIATPATWTEDNEPEDDVEGADLPREVEWDKLVKDGKLIGRFEGSQLSDIVWYFDFWAEFQHLPPPETAFPSASKGGPEGI